MSYRCSSIRNLSRALEIADFILEGHTIGDATIEFNICRSTVTRDINLIAAEAYYSNNPNSNELKKKYHQVRKKLSSKN